MSPIIRISSDDNIDDIILPKDKKDHFLPHKPRDIFCGSFT